MQLAAIDGATVSKFRPTFSTTSVDHLLPSRSKEHSGIPIKSLLQTKVSKEHTYKEAMRYQVLSATFLALVFVRVECFVPGSRSLEATVVRSISDVKTSWAFKRSRSTILHYRNAPHDNQVDFYNILGIPRTANDAEIKRAYRTKAKRFHPGKK